MEQEVYEYLIMNHKGKNNLIKNKDLRIKFGINSDKAMRKIIQNIREDKQYLEMIGSVSGVSGGFYCCVTEEEKQETIDNIKHRASKMYQMSYILEWKKNLGGI